MKIEVIKNTNIRFCFEDITMRKLIVKADFQTLNYLRDDV
jgi:hypothetical protein